MAPQVLARRLQSRQGTSRALAERRGEASLQRPNGPLIWVHGASVGEMLAAVPLIATAAGAGFRRARHFGHGDFRGARRAAPAGRRFASIHSARWAALRAAFPRSLADRPCSVCRIRSVAQSHFVMRGTKNSDDPDQRPTVGALVQPLAARAGRDRGVARPLRSVPGAVGCATPNAMRNLARRG